MARSAGCQPASSDVSSVPCRQAGGAPGLRYKKAGVAQETEVYLNKIASSIILAALHKQGAVQEQPYMPASIRLAKVMAPLWK